jgi:hypothetical protein
MNITMRIKTTMSIGLLTLNGFIQSGEAVPVQVPYSGQLAENGSLVNGAKSMTFHITDGGSSVYYDSGLLAVQVANGAFSVVLGGTGTSTLDSSVFDGTPRFLRVTVEGIVLSPLQPVHFTPHSVHAITSGSASNASIAASVAANSITGASIADGSVPPTKLNTTGASADQFLGYDGSTAQWAFLTLNAGPGLSGGGSDWPQSLSVSFGGDGLASTVARSDHNHITNTVNREYVVQYRESDFSFASRLLEEEGIYYSFQHDSTRNKIILADGRAGTNHAGPDFEFRAGDGAGLNQTGGNILLRPGRSTGTGSPGRVAIVGPTAADLNLDGLTDTIFAIRSRSDSPVHDGPALVLQGGDAAGANKSGGAVVLRPGTNSTSGTAPLKIETELVQLSLHSANPLPADLQVQRGGNAPGVLRYGTNDLWQISNAGGPFRSVATLDSDGLLDAAKLGGVSASSFARLDGSSQLFTGSNAFLGPVSFFGPGSQPFFVGTNANVVQNLNCDLLDGVSSEMFARLDLSNRFNAPITFTRPVEHETNACFKIKFNDLLVSSFSISGQGHGDPIPTESISFNFDTITHAHTNGLTNGASLRFKAGDAMAAGASGGDIELRPGVGAPGGRSGTLNLGSDTIKLGDALAGQDVILVVDQNPGQPHIRYDWAEDLWKVATAGGAIIPLDGNADTFDGLDSTAFARLSQDNLWSGAQTFNGGIAANAISTSTPLQGAAAKPGVAVNTAAPSVTNLTVLQLVNYIVPTEITELSGGVDGQVIVLVGGNNPAPVVVRDGGGQFNLTADWQAMPDHTLTLCRANGRWLETSRAAN